MSLPTTTSTPPPRMAKKREPMAVAAARVASRMLWDRMTGRKPQTLADVPGTPASITPEWMTLVMCPGVPGARVTSVRVEGGSLGSHERRRLVLDYNEAGQAAGLPPTVFIKTLSTLVTRMLGGFMGHARYEMLFYKRVRPELQIETPICHYSASDKTSLAAIHILEDLPATKGAIFCDEATVFTRQQAEGLVDIMADLHAPYYGSPRLKGDLAWVVDYHSWFVKGIERVHTDRYSAQALRKAEHVIPASILARRDEVWPATMRALELYRSGPQTLIHTDMHAGNWYIRGDGQVGLLDWQLITIGHYTRDLSHGLLTCLPTETRRLWERDLLRRYIDRMERNAGIRLSFDDAWLGYRQQALHTLTQWTQTLCHPPFQPDSHPDVRTYTFLQRITAAMEDLASLDSV